MALGNLTSNVSGCSDLSLTLNVHCFICAPTSVVFIMFSVSNTALLLPLCLFILLHGVRQWRTPWSHSDVFTFHMALMELLRVGGCCCCLVEIFLSIQQSLLILGTYVLFFSWYGQTFIHLLTVVERYLAVVHPMTYRGLKTQRGTRIRNVSMVCVWLLCLIKTPLLKLGERMIYGDFCMFLLILVLVSYCSSAVLRVLTRLSPSDQVGRRERVDQSKQRAFHTIGAILVVLAVKLIGNMTWAALHLSAAPAYCVFVIISIWFDLLSSLVTPLLFLKKEGKLSLKASS